MALSNTQKSKIRRWLGYSDINRIDTRFETAMDALSAEGETMVTGILTDLDTIDTAIKSAWTRLKVTVADEVTLNNDEFLALRSEGRRLANDLANCLNTTPLRKPFSSGSISNYLDRG